MVHPNSRFLKTFRVGPKKHLPVLRIVPKSSGCMAKKSSWLTLPRISSTFARRWCIFLPVGISLSIGSHPVHVFRFFSLLHYVPKSSPLLLKQIVHGLAAFLLSVFVKLFPFFEDTSLDKLARYMAILFNFSQFIIPMAVPVSRPEPFVAIHSRVGLTQVRQQSRCRPITNFWNSWKRF